MTKAIMQLFANDSALLKPRNFQHPENESGTWSYPHCTSRDMSIRRLNNRALTQHVRGKAAFRSVQQSSFPNLVITEEWDGVKNLSFRTPLAKGDHVIATHTIHPVTLKLYWGMYAVISKPPRAKTDCHWTGRLHVWQLSAKWSTHTGRKLSTPGPQVYLLQVY